MAAANGNAKMDRNGHAYECFVCKNECNLTCRRCGEFYCSKQCQTVDWPKHKYYCFEMPELLMIPSPEKDYRARNANPSNVHRENHQNGFNKNERRESKSYEKNAPSAHSSQSPQCVSSGPKKFTFADAPKNNDDVILTFVKKANVYYIRSCSSNNEYAKNAKDFDDYGKHAPKLVAAPQTNDIVLSLSDRKFQRALVLRVDSVEGIEVALADTGRILWKKLNDLRQISDELKTRKRHNFKVTLQHVQPGMKTEPFSKLIGFVKNKTVFTLQFDGNDFDSAENFRLLEKRSGTPIELLAANEANNSADNETASTVSLQELEAPITPTKVPETTTEPDQSTSAKLVSPKKYTTADLMTETLPKIADLMIVDNSHIDMGYVNAILTENAAAFSQMCIKYDNYGSNDQNVYRPELDEVCLVLWQNEWNRAVQCGGDRSLYRLIDWGVVGHIDEGDIRRLPEEFNDPCYTFTCVIDGFTKERSEYLSTLLGVYLDDVHYHKNCICVKGDDPYYYNVTFVENPAK